MAMECYFVDWNAYPKSHVTPSRAIPKEQQYRWFSALTSPVAYLTSMPPDPFQDSRTVWGDVYEMFGTYWLNIWYNTAPPVVLTDTWGPWEGFVPEMKARGLWWSLSSPGPDGDHDMGRPREGSYRFPTYTNRGAGMGAFYDPTNGTVSSGDVARLGPGASDQVTF